MFIIVLIFILLGSFVGGLSFWSGMTLYSVLAEPDGKGSLLSVLMLSVFGYPVSLIYGCVPATLAGLWYGLLLKRRTVVNHAPGKRLLIGLAIGFLVSSLFALMYVFPWMTIIVLSTYNQQSLPVPGGITTILETVLPFALPGALAAAVSGLCVSDRLYARLFGKRTPPQAATKGEDPQSHHQ